MVLVITCTVGIQQLCGKTEAWVVEPDRRWQWDFHREQTSWSDGCRLKNSLQFLSFPSRGKVSLLGDCPILLLGTLSFLRHTLLDKQSWTSPKLGKNIHLGPLLILSSLIQSVLIVETLRNKFCFKLILIKQISFK